MSIFHSNISRIKADRFEMKFILLKFPIKFTRYLHEKYNTQSHGNTRVHQSRNVKHSQDQVNTKDGGRHLNKIMKSSRWTNPKGCPPCDKEFSEIDCLVNLTSSILTTNSQFHHFQAIFHLGESKKSALSAGKASFSLRKS